VPGRKKTGSRYDAKRFGSRYSSVIPANAGTHDAGMTDECSIRREKIGRSDA
jgi:hypothetical protein